jgi:rhodanese-related sulfurtransferase
MKTILVAAIVVFAAAGASAFDFGSLFGGGKPAALKELPMAQIPAPSSPAAVTAPAKADFSLNIKPAAVQSFLEAKKPAVIDIRRPEEYAAGHLEAVNMQLDYYAPDFKEQLAKLDKGAPYLIYCRSGHRSGLTLGIMRELGFTEIHDIEGGITAWTAAGLPVVK